MRRRRPPGYAGGWTIGDKSMTQLPLFAIVLAAGEARRFGSGKQLARLDGEPLVRRAVRAAEAVCGANTVTVVGRQWQPVLAAANPLAGFAVLNDDPAAGMASSLIAGLAAVDTVASAVLLLLADQPLVGEAHLEALIAAWQQSPASIVCSSHAGVLSPPVVFPADCFSELAALSGDRGARSLLSRHSDRVIDIPDDGVAVDVDTLEDLAVAERLLHLLLNRHGGTSGTDD